MLTSLAAAQTASYSLSRHPSGNSNSGGGTTGTSNGISTATAGVSGKVTHQADAVYTVDEIVTVTWNGTSMNTPTVDSGSHYYFSYYTYAYAELNFTLPPSASASASGEADSLTASVTSPDGTEDDPSYVTNPVDGDASGITLAMMGGVWQGSTTANVSGLQAHAKITNPSGMGNASTFTDAYGKLSIGGDPTGPLSVTAH